MECASRARRDSHGQLIGFLATMIDITARQEAEDALRQSESRWRLLLESSGEGIYGVDLDGACTFVNPAAASMFGVDAEHMLGRPMHELVHHSYPDGSPYPADECRVMVPIRAGTAARGDDEWFWRADGTGFPVEFSTQPLLQEGALAGAVVNFTDITFRRAAEQEITHRSLHDALTGLPNRTLIIQRLEEVLVESTTGALCALLILDLDRFKDINDTFGHSIGDAVLQELARRMTAEGALPAAAVVGRLGGDEFAVVASGLASADQALEVGETLVRIVSTPIDADGQQFRIGCSVGIAVAPVHGDDPMTLLRHADVALYVAKGAEDSVAVYTSEADRVRLTRLQLINELRHAIANDELIVYYQPIVGIRTGHLSSLEALVRWQHPARGLVLPDEFIPVAEQAGVIMALTASVIRDALHQSRRWLSDGLRVPVAVNISAQTLHDPRLQAAIEEWYGGPAPAGPLELEITESAVLADPDAAVAVLSRLVSLGVRVSIDDFGTGYSSLAQLKRLPVSSVKVDRSFVGGMLTDARDESIVGSVIQLSHTMGLDVVAEGVESEASAIRLKELGCDYAQGWHYGRPMPAADMATVLREDGDLSRGDEE
jgi:diguanylate cyclase (GGDEF)-like protein/PAS domain S-box-containing protein